MNPKDQKVFLASARGVGEICTEWAKSNTPKGFCLTDSLADSDIVFSLKYDKIFNNKIIKTKKCFNFHPAPLPKYRGWGLMSWLIINNERKAGVSLHEIDNEVDTGDIIEVREFLISNEDTAETIFDRTEITLVKMFKDWYKDLLCGNFQSVPQKANEGKQYRKSDLRKAKNLTKFVRAFEFSGKESAYYFNDKGEKKYLNYKSS